MLSHRYILSVFRSELSTPLLLVILRTGGAVAAFFTSLIMARTMEPAEMGIALTCMSAAPIAAIFVTGSSEAGCVRFIIAYLDRDEMEKARGMVYFNRRVTLVIGAVLLIVLLIWQLWLIGGETDFPIVFAITAITAAMLGWLRIGAAHAMALGEVVRSLAPFSFFRQVIMLLGLVGLVLVDRSLDVETVVLIMLFSTGVVLVLQAALNHGPMQRIGTGPADMSDRREWTTVGLQLGLTLIFVQFSRDLTIVMSSFSLLPKDVGVLGIATAIVGFAKFFVIAVNQSITPKLSKAIARGDTDALVHMVAITNHLKFWPMVLAIIAFWLFGDNVAAIFGPDYADVASILVILALEPLALAFFGPGGNFLSLSGHQSVLLPLSGVTILLLAAAVTIGAYVDGLHGVALGSSITWIFWGASLAVLTRRYAGYNVTLFSSTLHLLRRGHQ